MYKKIDDIFEYQGITLQVVECTTKNINCKGCYFYETFKPCDLLCCSTDRKDNKNVIFKKYNNK